MKKVGILLFCFCFLAVSAQQPVAPGTGNSITNIYDSLGVLKAGEIQDWGFATFVKYNGHTILFDTGMDPEILEHNAKVLGIDLASVDIAILSHAHNDHAAGFAHFLKVNSRAEIYLPDDNRFFAAVGALPPGAQDATTRLPTGEQYYGGRKPQIQIKPADMFAGRAGVEAVEKSVEIASGVFLIHTTSPLLGSFSGYPPNSPEKPQLEGLAELSLALKTAQGLVVITGCSHSKVEQIVAAAQEVTGSKVDLLEGGFHLIGYSPDYSTAVAKKLKGELGVRRVAPTHCTGETAMAAFHQVFGENYLRAGLGSVIEF